MVDRLAAIPPTNLKIKQNEKANQNTQPEQKDNF